MTRRSLLDATVLVIMTVAAALLFVAWRVSHANGQSERKPTLTALKTEDVIGPSPTWYGATAAPVMVVEFADYQCPPCRISSAKLRTIIDNSKGKMRLTFRNCPLKAIHQNAESAAVTAEVARTCGKFWQVHDKLYDEQPKLSQISMKSILKNYGVSTAQTGRLYSIAQDRVAQDLQASKRFGVQGTPTFFVCKPGDKVFMLMDVTQIEEVAR